MSYSVYLTMDTGGGEHPTVFEVGNYTSNVSGMWELALGCKFRELDGKQAEECIQPLAKAVADMLNPAKRAEYVAMNPKNGWGDFEGAREFLAAFLEGCHRHPKATVKMYY